MSDERLNVVARDGTKLAVWVRGTGPALVLVHGSLMDHRRWDPVVAELEDSFSTFALDRRGFGASGDSSWYSIEREFDDVAVVVEAIANRTGGAVALWGHSYGANCAMGGAARSTNVSHLILYEPSLGLTFPAGLLDAVEQALAEGDRERAITLILVEVLGLTHEEIAVMKATPLWEVRLATAPTIARESRAEESWVWTPEMFAGITAPTLMLTGSDSPSSVARCTHHAASSIPEVRIHTLDGHGHMAHVTHPAMIATIIKEFIT